MYLFTPSANPIRRLSRLGDFRYEVPVGREVALGRLAEHTREFDPLGVGHRSGGVLAWLRGDRLRVWRATFWRRQPGRGALVLDGVVEERGDATVISGQVRLAPGFILGFVWVLLAIVLMVLARFPPVLVVAVLLVGLGQYVVLGVAAHRDAGPLLEFVDGAISGGTPKSF
ncbi:MAG: hypothetical protein M3010_00720 [Candidatus Dormibacteraeota bacterium]|nr:hypothetical protein [Candidatus Dormibacteraeota bacterium]